MTQDILALNHWFAQAGITPQHARETVTRKKGLLWLQKLNITASLQWENFSAYISFLTAFLSKMCSTKGEILYTHRTFWYRSLAADATGSSFCATSSPSSSASLISFCWCFSGNAGSNFFEIMVGPCWAFDHINIAELFSTQLSKPLQAFHPHHNLILKTQWKRMIARMTKPISKYESKWVPQRNTSVCHLNLQEDTVLGPVLAGIIVASSWNSIKLGEKVCKIQAYLHGKHWRCDRSLSSHVHQVTGVQTRLLCTRKWFKVEPRTLASAPSAPPMLFDSQYKSLSNPYQ